MAMDRNDDLPRIPAAQFKSECLHLLDAVAHSRRPIIVTKRGKPVAKLVPVEEEPIDIFGRMAGTIRICGDIVGPTSEDEEWTGDAENL
jgi:prevent-host-death family protein